MSNFLALRVFTSYDNYVFPRPKSPLPAPKAEEALFKVINFGQDGKIYPSLTLPADLFSSKEVFLKLPKISSFPLDVAKVKLVKPQVTQAVQSIYGVLFISEVYLI